MNDEQKTYQEQLLKHMRLQTGILFAILAIVLIAGVFLAVQVGGAMKMLNDIDLQKVNETITSLETVAGELDNVDMESINGAVNALKDAAGTLSQADISAINDGIRALSGAADNLKDLDMEKFNDLIESLQTVTNQMQTTTSALSKIFGKG